jgi:hypothetical protein
MPLQTPYREYFFPTLGLDAAGQPRVVGGPADDWAQVLGALPFQGYGVNPKSGEKQATNAPHHGITIMIDAGGHARGRIWLPTDVPVMHEGNAWFTHEIQVIADGPTAGTFVWAWQDKGGAPVRPFVADSEPPPVVTQPPVVTEPPPDAEHEERISALEGKVKVLEDQMLAFIPRMEAVERDVAQAAKRGDGVEVRVGRNLGHGHAATGTIL